MSLEEIGNIQHRFDLGFSSKKKFDDRRRRTVCHHRGKRGRCTSWLGRWCCWCSCRTARSSTPRTLLPQVNTSFLSMQPCRTRVLPLKLPIPLKIRRRLLTWIAFHREASNLEYHQRPFANFPHPISPSRLASIHSNWERRRLPLTETPGPRFASRDTCGNSQPGCCLDVLSPRRVANYPFQGPLTRHKPKFGVIRRNSHTRKGCANGELSTPRGQVGRQRASACARAWIW